MDHLQSEAANEWRRHWTLPVAAMIGYSATAIHAYSLGAFVVPLEEEFGWTRTQVTLGLTVTSLIGAAFSIAIGILVDRFGSRWLGLGGIVGVVGAFALLGTATGSMVNWVILWTVLGVANLFMQPTVWTKPVASRFERSRGFALAVTLAGGGIAAAVFPLLSNWMVRWLGWRAAFPAIGALWATLVLPIAYLFFRTEPRPRLGRVPDSRASPRVAAADLQGLTLREALRTAAFYKLLLASLLFVLTMIGVVVHFVPILTEHGTSPLRAAASASLIGISAIVGRLCTGLLLDRLPGHHVGAAIFVLPVAASTLLIFNGPDPIAQALAAIGFGLTLGAEVDVIAYLTIRYLGLRHFGVLFGAMTGALTLGGAIGPLAAGLVRDNWGHYNPFLLATVVCAAISCIGIASLGKPRYVAGH